MVKRAKGKLTNVALPNQNLITLPPYPSKRRVLSPRKQLMKLREATVERTKKFKEFAPTFRVPHTLEELGSQPIQAVETALEAIESNPDHVAQCCSGQYIDANGKPILYYLGHRLSDLKNERKRIRRLQDQEVGRSWEDIEGKKMVHDGIIGNPLRSYQAAVQTLCHHMQPNFPGNDSRHKPTDEDPTPDEMEYEIEDEDGNVEVAVEGGGVIHLVHAWPQQGQARKGIYPCSAFSNSSKRLAMIENYYRASEPVAQMLSAMFEVLFPKQYEAYKDAFKAGRWLAVDPGPWLGRALVYKLQVGMHKDKNDDGPSACFPAGDFEGGEMIIPQLNAKFKYEPGHVLIFFAGEIYHKVSHWTPKVEKAGQDLRTGRVSTVFFFPSWSLEELRGRYPRWGRKTWYGRNVDLTHPSSWPRKQDEKDKRKEELSNRRAKRRKLNSEVESDDAQESEGDTAEDPAGFVDDGKPLMMTR